MIEVDLYPGALLGKKALKVGKLWAASDWNNGGVA